jgi:hypothetical protein
MRKKDVWKVFLDYFVEMSEITSDEMKELARMKLQKKELREKTTITLKEFCSYQGMSFCNEEFESYLKRQHFYKTNYHKDTEWTDLTLFADNFLTEIPVIT